MSFIQEFVEQQFSKNISSNITNQLQICHSAVEDLLINLQSLRSTPKSKIINIKINRISVFFEARQDILKLIHADEQQPLIQWLIQEKLQSPLLVQLVRRQQNYVKEVLKKTIKNIFLNENKLDEYLLENEMISDCLSLLIAIRDDLSINRIPNRQKLMNVDNIEGIIWEKILLFQKKILLFNRSIANFIDQLYEFQNSIAEQFKLFLNKNEYKNLPLKSRIEVIDKSDQIYEQNIILNPANKGLDHQYSRTQGISKFGGQYKQQPLYHTGFPKKNNYTSKSKKKQISQLGLLSHLLINPSVTKEMERNTRSQFVEANSFLR